MTEKMTQKNFSLFAVLLLVAVAGLVGSLLTTSVSAAEGEGDSQTCSCPESRGVRGEVREAILENNFEKFQDAVEGTPIADQITDEETFSRFAEAHKLMKEGDAAGAKAIFEELGVRPPKKFGKFWPKPWSAEMPAVQS